MTAMVTAGRIASRSGAWTRLREGRALPILTVLAALVLVWYAGAVWLNAPQVIPQLEKAGTPWTWTDLTREAWAMKRPVLPAPHQVAVEIYESTTGPKLTSPRNLAYHGWITLSATFAGFGLGTLFGMLLAIGIIHVRTLDRSLMPWIIASQTVPILAIAPMVIVVLGSLGFTGLLPKAVIAAYLCFFPVTIGMVKGLRSPDPLQLDLMRTYSASRGQVLFKLRLPAALPFLFPSLKVAIALGIVGTIVSELPAGAQAGIGVRLLNGSYYGQTVQIWAALLLAAGLALLAVGAVALTERLVMRQMGGRT